MLVRPQKASKMLGVTTRSLRFWASNGKLSLHRTKGGHNRYDKEELEAMMNINQTVELDEDDPHNFPYGTN